MRFEALKIFPNIFLSHKIHANFQNYLFSKITLTFLLMAHYIKNISFTRRIFFYEKNERTYVVFSEARRVYEVGMPVKRSKLTIDNP